MTQTSPPGAAPARAGAAIEPAAGRTPGRIAWTLGVGELVIAGLGLIGLLLVALDLPLGLLVGLGVLISAVLIVAVRTGTADPPIGSGSLGRLLLLAAVVVVVAPGSPLVWLPVVLLAAAVTGEVVGARLVPIAVPCYASNLPGVDVRRNARVSAPLVLYVNAVALVLGLLAAALPVLTVLGWVAALASLGLTAVAVGDLAAWVRERRRAERRITKVLSKYAPGSPCTGTPRPAPATRSVGGCPTWTGSATATWCSSATRRIFEIGRPDDRPPGPAASRRRARWTRCGRQPPHACSTSTTRRATCTWSATSASGTSSSTTATATRPRATDPVFRIYDKNFVAGQAAVDRFCAHGVASARDIFEIVGRPQVEDDQRSPHPGHPGPSGFSTPRPGRATSDSAYSSLPIGPTIVPRPWSRAAASWSTGRTRTPAGRRACRRRPEQVTALLGRGPGPDRSAAPSSASRPSATGRSSTASTLSTRSSPTSPAWSPTSSTRRSRSRSRR